MKTHLNAEKTKYVATGQAGGEGGRLQAYRAVNVIWKGIPITASSSEIERWMNHGKWSMYQLKNGEPQYEYLLFSSSESSIKIISVASAIECPLHGTGTTGYEEVFPMPLVTSHSFLRKKKGK